MFLLCHIPKLLSETEVHLPGPPCSASTTNTQRLMESSVPAHLQQGGDGATGVPQHGCQVRHRLPLLAQLQEGILPGVRAGQLVDPLVDLLSVHLRQRRGYSLGTTHHTLSTQPAPDSVQKIYHMLQRS